MMTTSFFLLLLLLAQFLCSSSAVAATNHIQHTHHHHQQQQRYMEEGDFDSVNNLLNGTTISLPDVVITERYFLEDLVLNLTNILCSDLYVSDVAVQVLQDEEESVSRRSKTFLLEAIKIDTNCLVDYTYTYGVFSGSGVVQAFTEDNNLSVELEVAFSNETQAVPNVVEARNCTSLVEITNLVFDGGFVAGVLNVIDPAIRGIIESEINEFFCEELLKLNTAGTAFLQNISDFFDPYLDDDDSSLLVGPLVVDAPGSDNVSLINFEEPADGMAQTVDSLLEYAFEVLATNSTGADGNPTLGINDVVETFLLDENGVFVLNGSNIVNDGMLFNTSINEESFVYIEVSLKDVRMVGLNSFTRVDPLITEGPYTLQTGFALDQLDTVLDIELLFQSVSDDLEEDELAVITETATVGVALTGMDMSNTSLLIAMEEPKLAVLPFGAFLDTSRIFSCIASTLHDFDVNVLEFEASSLSEPTVGGLQSPGIERITQTAVQELYPLYRDAIFTALPNFIETTGKDLLVDFVQDVKDDPSACDASMWQQDYPEGTFVDFRAFFLEEEEAAALGFTDGSCCDYGDIGPKVRNLMDDELLALDPTTGLPKINTGLIDPLTSAQSNVSGTWNLGQDLLKLEAEFELDDALTGSATFSILEASIIRLDTIHATPLQVLEPTTHAHVLANEFTMGFQDRPLTLAARLLLDVKGDVNGDQNSIDIYNVVDLELDLVEVNVVLDLLISMLAQRVIEYPLQDVANVQCWLATIPAPELDDRGVRLEGEEVTAAIDALEILVKDLDLRMSCVNCSSPQLEEVTAALQDPSSREDAVKSANNVLDFATSVLQGDYIQLQIDRLLKAAPTKCPHRPEYIEDEEERETYAPFELEGEDRSNDAVAFLLTLCIVMVAVILVFFAIRYIVGVIVRRRHRDYLRSLPPEKLFRIYREQRWMQEREDRLTHCTRSMLYSEEDIPAWLRYLIPVILLGNIGFFLSGHLSEGGSVIVLFQFAGQEILIPDFFTFSVAQSTLDLWNAGGKELAILILLFSGVWPYTKMILTLYAWVVPPTRLSVSGRGRLIILLDELAKWSTIDIFVLVMSLIAFRVSLTSPQNLSFLPPDLYSLDLLVLPKWGLYANLIAQLLSQFTSHVIIHYHRKIVTNALSHSPSGEEDDSVGGAVEKPRTDEDEEEESPKKVAPQNGTDNHENRGEDSAAVASDDGISDSTTADDDDHEPHLLKDHGFVRPHRGESDALVVQGWVHYVVYATSIVLLPLLVIVGCILSSFSLEYLGLLGLGIESGQDFREAQYEYSAFGIVKALMEQASFLGEAKDYIGLGSIVCVFLLTVLVVPVLQAIALLIHWIRPMTRKQRKRWIVIVEILQAWQYVEVFVIAVILSAWQFASVSEFFLNQYCEALDDALATLAFYGILKEEDAQCFQVIATIKSGTYLLIAAAFLLNLFNTFVMKAVFQKEREEEQRQQQFLMSKLGEDSVLTSTRRLMEAEGNTDMEEIIAQIEPTPALFTDSFRWFLMPDPISKQKRLDSYCGFVMPEPQQQQGKEEYELSFENGSSSRPPRPASMGREISRDVDEGELIDVEEPSGPLGKQKSAAAPSSSLAPPSRLKSAASDGLSESGIYNYSDDDESVNETSLMKRMFWK